MTDIELNKEALEAAVIAADIDSYCYGKLGTDEFLETAIKAYLSHAQEDKWLDIESAPKHKEVMVYWKGQFWWGIQKTGNEWFVAFGTEHKKAEPTHWQPLPKPPEVKK